MYNSYGSNVRTVIVSNVPQRASEYQLGSFLNTYGKVLNVMLDSRRNEAQVEFADRKSVNIISSRNNIFFNGRKLHCRPVSNEGGYGGGHPQHRKPGPPQRSYGGGGQNRGPYGGQQSRDQMYNRPASYQGGGGGRNSRNQQYSAPRQNSSQGNRDNYNTKKKTGDIYHDKLCSELLKLDNVAEQMHKVRNTLLLKEADHTTRIKVKESLDQILRQTFPDSYTHIYGPVSYDLGVSRSDLSFYLNLDGSEFNSQKAENFDADYNINELPSTQLLTMGEISYHDIFELPVTAQLNFVCDLITGPIFKKAHVMPKAYSPRINFVHNATGLECTMKIKCGLDLRQSELFSLYMQYEPKMQSLIPTLYMFARQHALIGPNILSYYHFIILVIFFLQTKGVLPSVQKLQQLAEKKIIVDGIDCSFGTLEQLPPNTNVQPIEELMVEFFKYFGDFDFTLMVVSTYYGEPILKTSLPLRQDATKDLKINCLTIQDCFDLTKNTTEKCRLSFLYDVIEKFRVTKERVLSTEFATKAQNERHNWGIPLIVLKGISQLNFLSNIQPSKRSGSKFEIILPLRVPLLEYIEEKEALAKRTVEELKELFYEKVCHCIFSYLNRGYLFECTTIVDNLNTKLVPENFEIEETKPLPKELENGQSQGEKRPREEEEEKEKEKEETQEAKKVKPDVAANGEPAEESKEAAKPEKMETEEAEAKEEAKPTKEEAKPTKEEAKPTKEVKEEVKPVDPDLTDADVLYKGNFKSFHRTLMGRKQALGKITSESKVIQYLEQEHLISLYIAKEAGRKPLLSAFEFDAVMKKCQRGSLATLVVTLTPHSRTKEFVFLADMLQVRMNKIVEKILSKATMTLDNKEEAAAAAAAAAANKEESSETKPQEETDFTEDHYDEIDEVIDTKEDEEQAEQELLKDDGEGDLKEDEPVDDSILNDE